MLQMMKRLNKITLRNPGIILSTSWISFRFSARGSFTSIAISFQSVSPYTFKLNLILEYTANIYLVDHGENTQHFDLDHSAPLMDGLTNLTNINRIIVTLAVGGWVGVVWILIRGNYILGALSQDCLPPMFEGLPRSSKYTHGEGSS